MRFVLDELAYEMAKYCGALNRSDAQSYQLPPSPCHSSAPVLAPMKIVPQWVRYRSG